MAVIAQVPSVRNPRLNRVFSSMSRGAARHTRVMCGLFAVMVMTCLSTLPAQAAPYAAMVMDGRTGEVLHSRNADTRLHPASLTKMMTLYITFEAIRNGELTLDTKVKVSSNAAAEQPSKLGLRSGQKIAVRYLIRATAVKSANDAATALGEAISGSEAAFARRMTRTAKALGMSKTTFKNAHGLTAKGHMSTARDMTNLGRHMLYDYPEYYHLFSRTTIDAKVRKVANTNRRLLASYKGADGIKTGYTNAAGSNLVASAKRGNERIIATVFGGKSSTSRNAKITELLDLGFRRAPSHAKLRRPSRPAYQGNSGIRSAQNTTPAATQGAGKTIRVTGAVTKSLRPKTRPVRVQLAETDTEELKDSIHAALAEATQVQVTPAVATASDQAEAQIIAAVASVSTSVPVSRVQPYRGGLRPQARPAKFQSAATQDPAPVVVTRLSTSGGRYWGVSVGRYTNRFKAEKVLLKTALTEMSTLSGTLRKVVKSPRGFDATFQGLSQERAELACRRLAARNLTCRTIGPRS